MHANTESVGFLARLHAALDSLQTTEELILQLRQVESFRTQRVELRSAADLVTEAQGLMRVLIGEAA